MEYSNYGRTPETWTQQPWYGVAYTPPNIVETLRSTNTYTVEAPNHKETHEFGRTYASRGRNGGKFNRGNFKGHPEQNRNGFTMNRDQFPNLRGNHFSCPDLRGSGYYELETADSASVEYEPTPKRGHYRIMKRENKIVESRGSKGNYQNNRRNENAPRFIKAIKGKTPSVNRHLYASPSAIISPNMGRRTHNEDKIYDAASDCELHCNHCNARLKHRKKKRVDDSGNISFHQFLLQILSNDTQRSEETDFLTPMLLHSAYSNKTSNASNQLLLNILAESFALNMPDKELDNFTPAERKKRMSYTKSFVNLVSKTVTDLKARATSASESERLREFPALPRVDSKRLRSIYTNA